MFVCDKTDKRTHIVRMNGNKVNQENMHMMMMVMFKFVIKCKHENMYLLCSYIYVVSRTVRQAPTNDIRLENKFSLIRFYNRHTHTHARIHLSH